MPMSTKSPLRPETSVSSGRCAYKINEVADALGVTPITVRRLIQRGLLKPCRVLRHVLVPATELERLLKN